MSRFPYDWRWYLPFLWIPFAVCTMSLLAQVSWPTALGDWQGGNAPVEVLSNLVTPITALAAVIGLILNGRASNRTFEQARTAQLIATFQKAAEMLESNSEATTNAAIALLREIAGTQADLKGPVMDTLEGYITETDADNWLVATTSFADGALVHDIPTSRSSSLRAIQAISHINFPAAKAPYPINRPYLARWDVPDGSTFGRLNLRSARLSYVTFSGSFFTGSVMGASIGQAVIFRRCNFAGARFQLFDMAGKPIQPEQSHLVAFVDTGEHLDFLVNGMPFEEWQRRAPPPPRRDRDAKITT